ncbi:MAG: hypothetical protein ACO1NW_11860 [Chitinophagaceae bacterium]
MKIVSFLSHPILITALFCVLLISGEAWGGIYFQYIILGLIHGSGYAVTALIAICASFPATIAPLMASKISRLAMIILMPLSLFLFFTGERKTYYSATFEQPIPLLMLVFWGSCMLLLVFQTLLPTKKYGNEKKAIRQG